MTRRLVAQRARQIAARSVGRELAVAQVMLAVLNMQVAVANTRSQHLQQHLRAGGHGQRLVDRQQGLAEVGQVEAAHRGGHAQVLCLAALT